MTTKKPRWLFNFHDWSVEIVVVVDVVVVVDIVVVAGYFDGRALESPSIKKLSPLKSAWWRSLTLNCSDSSRHTNHIIIVVTAI